MYRTRRRPGPKSTKPVDPEDSNEETSEKETPTVSSPDKEESEEVEMPQKKFKKKSKKVVSDDEAEASKSDTEQQEDSKSDTKDPLNKSEDSDEDTSRKKKKKKKVAIADSEDELEALKSDNEDPLNNVEEEPKKEESSKNFEVGSEDEKEVAKSDRKAAKDSDDSDASEREEKRSKKKTKDSDEGTSKKKKKSPTKVIEDSENEVSRSDEEDPPSSSIDSPVKTKSKLKSKNVSENSDKDSKDPLDNSDEETSKKKSSQAVIKDSDDDDPLNTSDPLKENDFDLEFDKLKNGSETSADAKEPEDKDEGTSQEPQKPVLRLVPLNMLLKPEVLDKPGKKSPAVRKSCGRPKRNTSYIEISSDEAEVITSSSDSEAASSRRSSSKRSTNNHMTNGKSKHLSFKEPMSPSKILKHSKEISINLEKMPKNVNKLMKCYRVEDSKIESLSDTDDFENMISTSKIDRHATKAQEREKSPKPVERGRKGKKAVDVSDSSESVEQLKRPGRSSARNAKSQPMKSSDSESDSDDEKVSKKTKDSPPVRSGRSRRNASKEPETSKKKDLKITIKLNKRKGKKSEDDDSKSVSESSLSDDEPLQTKKSTKKKSTSESEAESSKGVTKDEAESDNESAPILDQKLRNRNKYVSNSAFASLKQKIEQRKSKREKSEEKESAQRTSRRKQNGTDDKKSSEKNNNKESDDDDDNGSEQSNNDDDDDKETNALINKSKKAAGKRKRVISSSDEEQEKSKPKPQPKKKKMSDDSDYNASSDDQAKESASSDDDQPRKRKAANSDDSNDTDDLQKNRPKEKRRKRIKKVASSDEDGEAGDKTKGRKNIRKLMGSDKLDVSTKEAAKFERERKQRIEERQKMYNQVYDERPEEAKEITQLVLDFDEETKKPLLEVDKKLAKKLKPHQANGVKFMWDACFESLERANNETGSGCILAHCMGLGKTLQVITLIHTLLKNSDETDVTRVLVVCPLSTVLNWVNEFNIWLKGVSGREDIYVYEINKLKQNVDRANKLMEWHNDGGIMILSYDMFRNLTSDGNRLRKKIKESLQTSLLDPGPDLVVCDEGHLLKNEKTSISKCMMKLRTLRRIVLTGTPLQNNLKEYYCMVQFVKPNLLGKYQEYLNRFVNPITNGQYTDSTAYDIQIMRRRAHVLHNMLSGCVQRRDYSVLAPFLPPKHEYVLSIKLTEMQIKLYKHYMENKARSNDENGGRKGSILFKDFQSLQRIWTAPLVLRYNSDRYEQERQRRRDLEDSEDESEGSLKDFIDDSDSAESTAESSSDDDSDDDDASIKSDDPKKGKKKKKKKEKSVPVPRRTRAKAADFPSDHEIEEVVTSKEENPTEWWMQICPEEELNNIEHSSKLSLLMSILEECEAIGDKLLVFSQSLYSLDVIEHFLNHIDEQTQSNAEKASFTGSWSLGQDYFRLDGSTPVEQRNAACKHFNSPSNPRARLFLISTRAGGLGINLVAANRVIIFDVSWNPSHDIQSIFRVYRFGQTKPCYIYRFLALGTMEEKIYERQVMKQSISKRVIDEQQIDRHYNQNDLAELYKYDLEPDDERILPILPKDRLFADMLKKFETTIYKYHEHDSLLENKEEETLNEEERKQAWEEFEQEKNRPQFVSQYYPQLQQPLRTGPVTSNNIFGIRTDVLLKLLSMKARLDNPKMTETSVKQAIPILMQELYRQMDRGELTLYQQLLALSSSLEVPANYGGQFRINEDMMQMTYNSMNPMPSTSSMLSQRILEGRQQAYMKYTQQQQQQQYQRQQMFAQQMRSKSPPRVIGSVIEID